MTDDEKELLLHMTGSAWGKKNQGFRNYGGFSPGSLNHQLIEGLADRGFARKYLTCDGLDFYVVTVAGCEAIGMTKAGTKRATQRLKKLTT